MRILPAVLLCLFAVTAHADEDPPPRVQGEMGASLLANSGNTNNSTYGLWGGVVFQPEAYKVSASGGFMRSTVEQVTSSRRSYAAFRGERTLFKRLSVDVRSDFYADAPAGTRHQYAIAAGGLFPVLSGERRALAVSLLVSKTWERRINPPDRVFVGTQLGVEFSAKVNETVTFAHESAYVRDFSDHDNWRATLKTSLLASLHRHLSLKVSHQLYRNKPDPGKRAVDMGLIASLVASWPAPKHP